LFPAESPYFSHLVSRITHHNLLRFLLLNRFFHNPYKTPTFGFAVGSAFSNLNDITQASLIMFVMNTEFRPTLYIFAIFRVLHFEVNSNFDAFVTAMAYHHSGHSF